MKWISLTGILLLWGNSNGSVLPAMPDASASVQAECLAGSEWEANCHYCRCSDTGVAECLKQSSCDDGVYVSKKASPPPGKECAAGSSWKNKCNDCVCGDNGYAVCNQTRCEGFDAEPEQKCAPDTEWVDDCNTCWCASGSAVCTRVGCLPTDLDAPFGKNIPETAIVEKTPAAKGEAANRTCVSKAMFIKDCNICWCNDDGTDYFCTRKVCVPELPDEPSVEVPEKLRIIKKECRPNEVFELDCNMCRCNPDGKSFSCTRRACLDLEDGKPEEDAKVSLSRKVRAAPQESPKACQPGQEFRLDCNKCLCDNEGLAFSCTRIDCVALNSQQANSGARSKRDVSSELVDVPSDCVPGSTYEKECNTCTCSKDGRRAKCTNADCERNQLGNDVQTTDPDPGFRCNPGEQFKRDCNDCTCSADGRSTFCTLRFCDEAMAQEMSP